MSLCADTVMPTLCDASYRGAVWKNTVKHLNQISNFV